MTEIIFGIQAVRNPNRIHDGMLSRDAFDRRFTSNAIEHRRSAEYKRKRLLLGSTEPQYAIIRRLGLLVPNRKPQVIIYEDEDPLKEKALLEVFWDDFKDHFDTLWSNGQGDPLVGYRVLDWSLPFLLKRTALLGLTPSRQIPLRRQANHAVYDIGIQWDRSLHPWTDLARMTKLFELDYKLSLLEGELRAVWDIYKRMHDASIGGQ